jgi:class 3 adenylate cyclase
LIENAGANFGLIVDLIEDQIIVRARIYLDDTLKDLESSKENVDFPKTLIHAAFRRNEAIVIDNASELNSFSSDSYFKKRKTLSVICVPLTLHGKRTSAIYMENNLIHSAFTKERVKVIEMLSAQATISMENAKIYEQQKSLLSAQQRFVPSQFLKHLGHQDITKVTLGESVTMDMSVLFTDILDFTPLVERRPPQEVIRFLNRLFNKMGGVIKEWNGFVDSYAGDQIMALFSMPVHQSIYGAIKMIEALRAFNKESEKYDFPPVEMGIGINTGSLVLGTMGAVDRMQCSVLGDTVNLASRIEQLTRKYGAKILIGEQTYEALENRELFSIRMVDYVAVKGKGIAIKIYEIMDAEAEERRKTKLKTLPLLRKGLDSYFSKDFEQAENQFKEAISIDDKDPVLKLFLDRSQNYILQPPPQDWAGFEKLQQK